MISLHRSNCERVGIQLKPGGDRVGHFNPDEARALVEKFKREGKIKSAGEAVAVARDGEDVFLQHFGVQARWVKVTPEMAETWLQNNFVNRPMSEDTVIAYARDMAGGRWVPTHQGIAFNDRDELIDGQHRLSAIVRSGKTIKMMVTFGLPSKIEGREMTTMDCVDRGRTRSVADQLKIQHGMKDGSAIAAVSQQLATLCANDRTRRLSVGQTLEIFREFEKPVLRVIELRSREHGLRQKGVLAGFAFAAATHHGEAVWEMFSQVLSGEGLKAGSAMDRLREFLLSEDAKLLSQGTDRGIAELVLEAIRLQLRGRPVPKLVLSTEGADFFRKAQKDRVERIGAMFRLEAKS